MNAQEKLNRIKEICQELLYLSEKVNPNKFVGDGYNAPAEAGWRATIAAIDNIPMHCEECGSPTALDEILNAWEDQL